MVLRSAAVLVAAAAVLACGAGRVTAPHPESAPGWQLGWAEGITFYEIFVRSFADSDGDGIGDLRGLTSRLDHLNDGDPTTTDDLGVEGIWLMPIFPSPSYHGYDAVDYEGVNPEYGTLEDLEVLLEEAHRRGIRVILDLMINHTSDRHPWFVESASGPGSPRRDWYVWREEDPGWRQPWGDQGWPVWHERNGAFYYGIFWGGMPDLNLENPAVVAEVGRIMELWLARGIDGFRLDAARHLVADGPGEAQNDTPETHEVWRRLSARARAADPAALLVGESWTDVERIAPYYGSTERVAGGDELPMLFDFPLADAILTAVEDRDASPVAAALARKAALEPPGVLSGTFLANHDMVRVATRLGDGSRLRSAAAILLTLPGTPFLYYGEEIGMLNGDLADGDPAKREPMPWDGSPTGGFSSGVPWRTLPPDHERRNLAAQAADPGSLLHHYRGLVHLRASNPALRRGGVEVLTAADRTSPLLAYLRTAPAQRLLVVHNLGANPLRAGPYPLAEVAVPIWTSGGANAEPGPSGIEISLTGGASGVWTLN